MSLSDQQPETFVTTSDRPPFGMEMPRKFSVAIIICTRKRPEFLRDCLEGIAKLGRTPDELIVIDNSQGDEQTKRLAADHSARYLIEPITGLSRARNRGLAESRCELVAFLDDDAVPKEHWLDLLTGPFEDPRVAAVTGGIISREPLNSRDADQPRSLSSTDPKWFEIAGFGGLGIGANMALRKAACRESDFFDLRLGRGAVLDSGEESLAFVRLLSRGYSAVHLPDAAVTHSRKPVDVRQKASYAVAYSLILFFEFPQHRYELLQFVFRRLRHKPRSWYRSSPDFGPVITSSWLVRIRACLAGISLYLRSKRGETR